MTARKDAIITPRSEIGNPRSAIRDLLGGRMPAVMQSLPRALTMGAASFRAAVLAAGVSAVLACVPAMAATSFSTDFAGPELDANLMTTMLPSGAAVTVNGQAVFTGPVAGPTNTRTYVGTVGADYATSAQNWTATIEVLAPVVANAGNFFGLGTGTYSGGGGPSLYGTPQGATENQPALYAYMFVPGHSASVDIQRKQSSAAYWTGFTSNSDSQFDLAAGTTGGVEANAFYRYSMAYDYVTQTVTFDVEKISGFGGSVLSSGPGNLGVFSLDGMGFNGTNGRIFFGGDHNTFDNFSVNVGSPGNTATTTTVATSGDPVTADAPVTFTATVAPAIGTTVPTGSVQFQVDGVNVGSPVAVTAGTPGPNGTAALVTTAPAVAGSHTVTANYTATGGFNNSSGSTPVTVNATTATVLAFTTAPGNAYAGSAFGTQPVVVTRDAYGNLSTVGLAASETVTIAIKTGTGTLSGTTTYDIGTGAGNGTITGSDLAIDTAGGFTLSANAPGLTESESASFTVQAADANLLTNPGFEANAVGANPATGWSNTAGNVGVTDYATAGIGIGAHEGTKEWMFQQNSPSLSQSVALPAGNYSLSMWIASRNYAGYGIVSGNATFQLLDSGNNVVTPISSSSPEYNSPAGTWVNWTRTYTSLAAGTYTVKVSPGANNSTGYAQGMVDDFSLTRITGTLTTTTVGSSANPSTAGASVTFTATVAPAGGETVPAGSVQFQVDGVNVGSPVAVTAGTGSNGAAALVTSALTVAGSHTITAVYAATSGFISSSGSASQTVTATTATALAFTTAPWYAYAGSAFGTQPVVKTRDAYGNNSTVGLAASKTVTIAIKTGTGTLTGTTTYDIGTGAGNGTITGSGLAIDAAGGFTLSATAPGLTEGDSASFTVLAADAAQVAGSIPADKLAKCNVLWDSPSDDSFGAMPLGNGDLALSYWAQTNGSIYFYVGKSDSVDENGALLKLGRVRVTFSPNPFASGQPFRQELQLIKGQIVLTGGAPGSQVRVTAWVDANHPAAYLDVASDQPVGVTVALEPWRTSQVAITGSDLPYEWCSESGSSSNTLYSDADTFLNEANRLVWYHRNERSTWPDNLQLVNLGSVIANHTDPLLHRTMGALIQGTGMQQANPKTLQTPAPVTNTTVALYALTARTATAADWRSALNTVVAQASAPTHADALAAHQAWWQAFWNRSWIFVSNNGPVTYDAGLSQEDWINRGYALQRYLIACAGRGALPIKFNGSLFTVDTQAGGTYPGLSGGDVGRNADHRRWGACYWLQNTRLPYWSMLAAGDYEMAQPLFNMLSEALPLARDRVRTYYGHAGAVFPETMFFWGNNNVTNYGWPSERGGYAPGDPRNSYIRNHFTGTLEISLMMLDWYSHTRDQTTLQNTILPMVRDFLTFWSLHFPTNAQGKLILSPGNSLETYQGCTGSTPDIAGLQKVCTELLALPASQTTVADRAQWQSLLNTVPPLPFGTSGSGTVILPAQSYGSPANSENPELYPVFPFRLYMLQKANLAVARATFANRRFQTIGGWYQDPIDKACLGDAGAAQADVFGIFRSHNSRARFPAMWGPNYDYVPDMDHGSVGMIALQSMLLQADGQNILLQPAWPANWDVDFRLHTLRQTTVTGTVRAGQPSYVVTPLARLGEVLVGSSLTPGRLLTYGQWLNYYPALGAAAEPLADFDGDAVCNLLEYAAATDPTDPQSKPGLSVTLDPGQSQATISYQRNVFANDLTWTLQQSGDLQNWSPLADISGGTDGAVELRTATVPMASANRFYRLNISSTTP